MSAIFLPEPIEKVRFMASPAGSEHAWLAVATRRHVSTVAMATHSGALTRLATARLPGAGEIVDLCVISSSSTSSSSSSTSISNALVAVTDSTGALTCFAIDNNRILKHSEHLNAHRGAASCVSAQRHTRRVVTGGEDGRVVVRHESNVSAPLTAFDGDGAAVNRVIFDGDGEVVLSANAVGQLCFWDARVSSGRPAKSMRDGLSASAIWSLAQHPARPSMVASGAADGSVSLWDTRAERWPLSRSLAHAGDVWDLAFTALADRLASVGADGTCLLWELASGTPSVAELQTHETPLLSVAAHTSLNMVVAGAASGGLIATSF